jgi:hypothetical protein
MLTVSFWTAKTAFMSCMLVARAICIGSQSVQMSEVLLARSLREPGCSEILAVERLRILRGDMSSPVFSKEFKWSAARTDQRARHTVTLRYACERCSGATCMSNPKHLLAKSGISNPDHLLHPAPSRGSRYSEKSGRSRSGLRQGHNVLKAVPAPNARAPAVQTCATRLRTSHQASR